MKITSIICWQFNLIWSLSKYRARNCSQKKKLNYAFHNKRSWKKYYLIRWSFCIARNLDIDFNFQKYNSKAFRCDGKKILFRLQLISFSYLSRFYVLSSLLNMRLDFIQHENHIFSAPTFSRKSSCLSRFLSLGRCIFTTIDV